MSRDSLNTTNEYALHIFLCRDMNQGDREQAREREREQARKREREREIMKIKIENIYIYKKKHCVAVHLIYKRHDRNTDKLVIKVNEIKQ